jgi:hypothetical protein
LEAVAAHVPLVDPDEGTEWWAAEPYSPILPMLARGRALDLVG